jgi:hypothetical protein
VLELTDRHLHLLKGLHNAITTDWNKGGYRLNLIKYLGITDIFKTEGYWRSTIDSEEYEDSRLPWPEPNQYSLSSIAYFMPKLRTVERKAEHRHFMGFSKCRICGCMNGTGEYYWQGWVWPDGLKHYIEDHSVAPTKGFVEFITAESTRKKVHSRKC